jgi:subtilase family serine protease
VALYEGTISSANKIAQQTKGFPGQSSVKVSFPVTISDGNEHKFHISVDPENLVKESNESNNAALNILYPTSTYDFEILPSDLSVSPNLVDIFQDVKITSRITNKGTMNANNVQVRYYIDEAGNGLDIATVTIDVPAGSTIANAITWRTIKAGENLKVSVHVDPFDSYDELSETNNKAFAYITVRGSTDPNLTVSYEDIAITPSPANERGNTNISALVKNEGFSAATSVKVNFHKGTPGVDGVLLGSKIIPSLNAGESRSVSIDWLNIMESGERIIYVQVDPENQITEIKEDDNSAFVTFKILSLPDLTLSTNSITFNPSAPKDGDTVAVTVTVQNKGEQNALNVTVRAHEISATIGTQVIPSIAGNSQGVATISYNTTGKSGPHQITAIVDPDNTISEQSEDNNRASRSFGVQDANLWLTEKYISPNGDGVKDSTQFFFRLNTPQTVKIAVVDDKAEMVRTFGEADFENTTGGNITWDGFNDKGMVMSDTPDKGT